MNSKTWVDVGKTGRVIELIEKNGVSGEWLWSCVDEMSVSVIDDEGI